MQTQKLNRFQVCGFSTIAFWCAMSTVVTAYPGEPITWGSWVFHEDATFIPAQISACTDPDGRLRTLFVDTQGIRTYTENSVAHQVHHAVMCSFRALPNGSVLNEAVDATLGDYTSLIGRDDDVSVAVAARPQRTSVYSVLGRQGTLVYGGGYQHKLETETFGETFLPSNVYHGNFVALGGRVPLESIASSFPLGFTGAEGNLLSALSAPGGIENRISLVNRRAGDVRLVFYEYGASPALYFVVKLSALRGAGWTTDRIITGGSLVVTPDRRDFYCFVTSRKNGIAGAFSLEGTVWHVRTATTTSLDGDGDPVIDIDHIETKVVFSESYVASDPDTLTYPQILLTSAGEPKWIIYSNRYGTDFNSLVRMEKRNTVTAFGSAQQNLRSISQGFGGAGSSFYGSATGGSAGLDRLDRLHLAFQNIHNAANPRLIHARETASGSFKASPTFNGRCYGAPALAVGPGDYPYIVYRGSAPDSPTDPKLVFAYPTGLRAAYRGDYEDRDKDGRIGLLEFAQGTSDTVPNAVASIDSEFTTLPSGEKVPLLRYMLNDQAAHISQDQFQITQGADVIDIRLAYSYGSNSLRNWSLGGFIKKAENRFAPGWKIIDMQDNITSLQSPSVSGKAFYRLQVTRIEGPP